MEPDLKKLHNLLVKIERRGTNTKKSSSDDTDAKLVIGIKETNDRLRRIENLLKRIDNTTKTLQSNNVEVGKERDRN